jgi:putative peptide zinc metalloprotease protein
MVTQEPMRRAGVPPLPKLIDNVGVWLFYPRGYRSEEIYTIGSVVADRYIAVPGSKLSAVQAFMRELDGTRTLPQIQDTLVREQGLVIDVEALHRKFQRAGLLTESASDQGRDIQDMSATLLRLPLDRLLRWFSRLSPLAGPTAYFGAGLIAAAVVLLLRDPSLLQLMTKPVAPDMSRMGSFAQAALVACLSMMVHELSHCFAASRWGIRSGTVRFQLYLGTIPIVGLRLAGLYTLPPRGRLMVWSAGVFANLSIAAGALLALRTVAPGSAALELTMAMNWLLAVFNLMPLLPTDGYFLLCTLMRDSNVRLRAWSWIRRPVRHSRKRPSPFVLLYMIATVWLLLSTLWHLALRLIDAEASHSRWQSAVSVLFLAIFLVTLWRTFRRTQELE